MWDEFSLMESTESGENNGLSFYLTIWTNGGKHHLHVNLEWHVDLLLLSHEW